MPSNSTTVNFESDYLDSSVVVEWGISGPRRRVCKTKLHVIREINSTAYLPYVAPAVSPVVCFIGNFTCNTYSSDELILIQIRVQIKTLRGVRLED